MERNQKKTALRCVEFLYDDKLGTQEIVPEEELLILDMGCGTGYSSEILLNYGFRVIGIDILSDMMQKAVDKKKHYKWRDLCLILCDINHLPFKESTIDHAISVSAYNFITANEKNRNKKEYIANKTANRLRKILKVNGRIVIEFYPEDENDLNLFTTSFTKNKFTGFMIKDNPRQKGGKSYLLLKKE